MAQQIQIRRDNASSWASVNPILAQGEIAYELDTKKMKIGDGTYSYASLPYFGGSPALVSLNDVLVSSLASGDVLIANTSGTFLNKSLASLIQGVTSLGSLAVLDDFSYTSLLNRPSLGSLAPLNDLSYNSLLNLPSLGSLAPLNDFSYTSLLNRPSLGSLAPLNDLSYNSLLNLPSLGSLAPLNSLSYNSLTNLPSLGSLAPLNELSYTSLINRPSLGSLAPLNAVTQSFLPSTISFANVVTRTLAVESIASISNIRANGILVSTASMGALNSGVYNLYEGTTQKAIFDGTFAGRFRALASQETFLFENYETMKMTDNFGQDVWKVDGVNFIITKTLFANAGSQNFGNANATTITTQTLNAQVVAASNISVGTFNTTNLVAQGILASMVSASDVYSALVFGDTVYGGVGNFDQANASGLNFDSAFGLYMGLGGGVTSAALTIDSTNLTYSRTAINYPSTASTYSWLGYTYTVNGGFAGGLYRRVDTSDVGLWTQGSGSFPRVLFANNGRVKVGNYAATEVPNGLVHVDQASTTAAIPTLELNQDDVSEEFINFVGLATTNLNLPISTNATATTIARKVRVAANGSFFWLYLYNG